MNSLTFTRVKKFTSLFILLITCSAAFADWKIDMSRRAKELDRSKIILGDDKNEKPSETLYDTIFNKNEVSQELVILHTDKGFIPATIRVLENRTYKIHVVNVNEADRNVSFIMDAFSEHHATFYGKLKTFTITPKKEGVFSFQSPETNAQGRFIVLDAPAKAAEFGDRTPASEE